GRLAWAFLRSPAPLLPPSHSREGAWTRSHAVFSGHVGSGPGPCRYRMAVRVRSLSNPVGHSEVTRANVFVCSFLVARACRRSGLILEIRTPLDRGRVGSFARASTLFDTRHLGAKRGRPDRFRR